MGGGAVSGRRQAGPCIEWHMQPDWWEALPAWLKPPSERQLCPAAVSPQGLSVQVWRKYEDFIKELSGRQGHGGRETEDTPGCGSPPTVWGSLVGKCSSLVSTLGAPSVVPAAHRPSWYPLTGSADALPACHADDHAGAAARFPHESSGIKKFYDECWAVFNALNSLELKSLEEPRWGQGHTRTALERKGRSRPSNPTRRSG